MKKRIFILFVFIFILLTIISISAPTYKNYNNLNHMENKQFMDSSNNNKNIKNIDIKYSKTFFITHENGRSYFRTYSNLNKNNKRSNIKYTNNNQKGIYWNLWDSGHKPKSRSKPFFAEFKTKKKINCPIGWECSK